MEPAQQASLLLNQMGYWHLEAASQTEDGEGCQVREKESMNYVAVLCNGPGTIGGWGRVGERKRERERERRVREGGTPVMLNLFSSVDYSRASVYPCVRSHVVSRVSNSKLCNHNIRSVINNIAQH